MGAAAPATAPVPPTPSWLAVKELLEQLRLEPEGMDLDAITGEEDLRPVLAELNPAQAAALLARIPEDDPLRGWLDTDSVSALAFSIT